MFCPCEFGVETPMRLVSERQAHCSPAGWRVRHPCGSLLVLGRAPGSAGVVGVAGVVGAVGAGVVFGVGGWTPLGFGLAGCVTGGGVCAPGGVVCCVCANAIGEASKSAAAVKASVRFIGILRGAPSHPEPTSPRPRGFREKPYHSAIPTHAHASKASAACA